MITLPIGLQVEPAPAGCFRTPREGGRVSIACSDPDASASGQLVWRNAFAAFGADLRRQPAGTAGESDTVIPYGLPRGGECATASPVSTPTNHDEADPGSAGGPPARKEKPAARRRSHPRTHTQAALSGVSQWAELGDQNTRFTRVRFGVRVSTEGYPSGHPLRFLEVVNALRHLPLNAFEFDAEADPGSAGGPPARKEKPTGRRRSRLPHAHLLPDRLVSIKARQLAAGVASIGAKLAA